MIDMLSLDRPIRMLKSFRYGRGLAWRLDRLRLRLAVGIGYGGRMVLFLIVALGGGYGTAAYMASQPTRLTAERNGPWVAWLFAGRPDADPYTALRFAQIGSLPLNASAVLTYEARTDSDGRRLQSSCEYVIEGAEPPASWWSVAVFDQNGRLIPNSADRYAFNASNVTRGPDGRIVITLSREARPGNWLPLGAGGRLALTFTLYGVVSEVSGAGDPSAQRRITLPTIRRLACA